MTHSSGELLFIKTKSREEPFIGNCKQMSAASCALMFTALRNLLPTSFVCCFTIRLPKFLFLEKLDEGVHSNLRDFVT